MATVSDFTALISGTSWTTAAGTPTVLTYSFETSPDPYLTDRGFAQNFLNSFQGFSGSQQATTRAALTQWANASGLEFVEVAAGTGDLRFGNYNLDLDGHTTADGYAYYPYRTLNWSGSYDSELGGDVFIDLMIMTAMPTALILHEIGHALGLKHPGEGDPTLEQGYRTPSFTIMNAIGDYGVTTLGTLDRAAAAYLYGPDDLNNPDAAGIRSFDVDAGAFRASQSWGTAASGILGSSLHDVILAGAGNDTVAGMRGNDTIRGEAGADELFGEEGHDVLIGGEGADLIEGGTGNDRLEGGLAADTLRGDEGADTLYGGAGNDQLNGDDGDDLIFGDAGNDLINGGAGRNTLYGGAGADTYSGWDGVDTVDFTTAQGRVLVDLFQDVSWEAYARFFTDGAGDGDMFHAIEHATGGRFSDQLRGSGGANIMSGGDGWDRLYGRSGNDTLLGGGGSDAIYGNLGADVMTGGSGAMRDRYIYFGTGESGVGAGNRDVITDFQPGFDRIEISRFDADSTLAGRQDFDWLGTAAFSGTAGELRYLSSGGITLVQADLDGDALADFEIELSGTVRLSEDNFLL